MTGTSRRAVPSPEGTALPIPSTVAGWKTHLQFVHGVYVGDVHTVAGMREAHDACHTALSTGERWDDVIIRHTHGATPEPKPTLQEWMW